MRRVILAALIGAASILAQTSASLNGQLPVTDAPIGWGSNMSASLYVTSSGYLRDSANSRVALDTSLTSVGGAGACSQSITIRSGTGGTVPQSYSQTSLRMRATDVSQDGILVYLAMRWKNTPTGTDSGWVVQSRNRLWDSSYVYSTLTNPALTTSYTTWWMNGFVSGQEVRVCVARTSGGPGAGDTVVFNNNRLRAW